VKELTGLGIQPDILLCRTDRYLDRKIKTKIAHFCNVAESAVITAKDVEWIYEVPLVFHEEGLDERVVEKLNIWTGAPHLDKWQRTVQVLKDPKDSVRIAVVGKYMSLKESYKSLLEALVHGGIANEARVEIDCIEAEKIEQEGVEALLKQADGILIPGGFGDRGSEGKIAAIRYARENQTPFFGICLGMQMATIEFARHACGIEDATSSEFDPDGANPVIALMPDQVGVLAKGGTMRLGAYPCLLHEGTLARRIYDEEMVSERHRHRYEVNNAYRGVLAEHGMVFSGTSPDERLVEMIELPDHPWFIGCQFHPDVKSRPIRPHPLFRDFVRAAVEHRERRGAEESSRQESATREEEEVAT
jgi:CTP synthase